MANLSMISSKFDNIKIVNEGKICTTENISNVLEYLKNTPEFDFDMLTSIIAVDYVEYIELIYQLMSSKNAQTLSISYCAYDKKAKSVVNVYPSAHFDECEIYDLFGVKFDGNNNLKRLLMPENWSGHPLLKSYVQNDERLAWNV